MKFLHVADLHIGKILNQKSLLEDQKVILNQIIEMMKENDCKVLLISGDIYDRSVPASDAVEVFNDFLSECILNLGYSVYIITGNHDSSERLDFASGILKNKGLIIESFTKKPLVSYILSDEYGPVHFYMMPFCTPLYSRIHYGTEVKTFGDMIRDFIDATPINVSERNVLLTHHTVLHKGELIKSDSESDISIGGTDGVESSVFNSFDYVALGHIHAPQYLGKETVRYAGSPLKYSESEACNIKSACLVELKEKGNVNVTLLPFKPLHDVRKLEGLMDDLLKEESSDYVYVTLLDSSIIPDAMHRIRNRYPNAVSLCYKQLKNTKSDMKMSGDFHSKSMSEQFSEFFEAVTGNKLSDTQEEIVKESVGKVNEAN